MRTILQNAQVLQLLKPDNLPATSDYRFSNKTTVQLIAQGYQIIFFYDSKTGKRVPISGEFRKLL